MRNFLIKNATVFEGTNTRGKYHWVVASLWDYEHPQLNPQELPVTVITNEEQALKFFKCSTAINDPNDRRFSEKLKGYEFNLEAAIKAIQEEKFADGTPCKIQTFDASTMTFGTAKDNFVIKPNMQRFEHALKTPHCQIARRDTKVILRSGREVTIKAGQPLVGKNGAVTPITKLYAWIQIGPDGEPIENVEDIFNRIIESRYAPMNASPANAPAAATAEETQPEGDTATEAAAEAAATALGGISLS